MSDLHLRRGSTASDGFTLVVTPQSANWGFSNLRTLDLPASQSFSFETGADEMLALTGRRGVFAGPTDLAYLPRGSRVTLSSVAGGRFALPGARARARLPFRYGPVTDVPVELRGAGSMSRQVISFCTPDAFEADRLIAQRVYGDARRPGDVLAEVRTGDVVLIPHGWHGPSMAGPGDQRAWLICDDPEHAGVRQTWQGVPVHPRLPFTPGGPA